MDIRPQGLEPAALPLRDAVTANAPETATPPPSAPPADLDQLALTSTVPVLQPAPAPGASQDDHRGFFSELAEKLGDALGDVVVAGSAVPILGKLGYAIYGALTKPKPGDPPLKNLGTLCDTVRRGAQPTEAGYAELKAEGVDTVINLRPEAPWAKAMAEGQGLRCIDMPLPAIGACTNAQAMAFLSAVTDPANGTVYFNCQRGKDRTGAMAAAYRIAAQGWSLDQAAAEMRQFGFKEGVESDKLEFLRGFDAYWKSLPASVQAQALHRSPAA